MFETVLDFLTSHFDKLLSAFDAADKVKKKINDLKPIYLNVNDINYVRSYCHLSMEFTNKTDKPIPVTDIWVSQDDFRSIAEHKSSLYREIVRPGYTDRTFTLEIPFVIPAHDSVKGVVKLRKLDRHFSAVNSVVTVMSCTKEYKIPVIIGNDGTLSVTGRAKETRL